MLNGRTSNARWTRLGCVMLSLACVLIANPVLAQTQAPQKAAGGPLTIDLTAQKPWTGDLEG